MFDFLLARNPISAIYLAVAVSRFQVDCTPPRRKLIESYQMLIAKKSQMIKLAKKLGAEAMEDPSLLHPLFARLPPLYPDTPDSPLPNSNTKTPHDQGRDLDGEYYDDDTNPYEAIPLSRVFAITDDLLARYPWNGPLIRGDEVMGPHSVMQTYDKEADPDCRLGQAERLIDDQVILPGATEPDEDDEEVPPTIPIRRARLPRNKFGTAMAVGVMVVGIGIAMYGLKANSKSGWRGWWTVVARSWSSPPRVSEIFGRTDSFELLRERLRKLL